MAEGLTYYRILLPLRLRWNPTYSFNGTLRRGERVRVTFAKREYVGVVLGTVPVPDISPERILPLTGPIDGLPDITDEELQLWEFISSYYMCPEGEVYKAAYPAFKTQSEIVSARRAVRNGDTETSAAQMHIRLRTSPKPEVIVGFNRLPFYINAIRDTLSQGRSALVLVSETSVGENIGRSLERTFSGSVMPFNFKLTPAKRRKVAEALRDTTSPELVIGTRSALFLPFRDLGLVIVDEEQDATYKQTEPAPRYNARDLAIKLAQIHDAAAVLGSCCPSMETELNIRNGKYTRLDTPEKGAPVEVIDTSEEMRKQGMRGYFSLKMLSGLKNAGRILIVRGWEKEDELAGQCRSLLPSSHVDILTAGAARTSSCVYDCVAVMQADAFSDSGDFRSDERLLQLLLSISERAPRMIVQTSRGSHPLFNALRSGHTDESMLKERADFNLPPFRRIVDIKAGAFSDEFARLLPVEHIRKGDTIRISLPRSAAASSIKNSIFELAGNFEKRFSGKAHIIFDVDPV